jgi:NAD(P)-dependent dehydrogenase (short-subunit alcohol dehydrogenase family)
MKDVIARDIPLGRLADAADIAAAIRFLASPHAAYITAEQLTVDGGWTRL